MPNDRRARDAGPGPSTRRGLLQRALALGVTTAGGALLALRPANAGSQPLELNRVNAIEQTTGVEGSARGGAFVVNNENARAAAIIGSLSSGTVPAISRSHEVAVLGYNTNERLKFPPVGVAGVARGQDAIGVQAIAQSGVGLEAWGRDAGVRAVARLGRKGSVGVSGNGEIGVQGFGPIAGAFNASIDGVALEAVGRIATSQAGIELVPAGVRFHDVAHRASLLGSNPVIFAQVQGRGDIFVTGSHRVDKNTFRVHLSAESPPGGLRLGYLVLDGQGPISRPDGA